MMGLYKYKWMKQQAVVYDCSQGNVVDFDLQCQLQPVCSSVKGLPDGPLQIQMDEMKACHVCL